MKISMFRSHGLLMASLLFVAGALLTVPSRGDTQASGASRPEAAAASAVPAEPSAPAHPVAPVVPAAPAQPVARGTATNGTPATGTEADAAPSSTAPADAHGADWDARDDHDDQSDDADHEEDADHKGDADQDAAGRATTEGPRHASRKHNHSGGGHDNQLVNVGDDSVLEAGKEADSVVSVFGNSRDEGTVREDVVSVFGNTYVDGKVGGDAVSVFGNVELGPHAEVAGDVTTVFGKLRRDPAAIVRGYAHSVFAHDFSVPSGLRSWIENCLMYGRPLALTHDLGWAWGLALSLLALYLCLALVFRTGVERCVETFERQPGPSVLAALLAVLLTPVLIVLLCITVVGIAAVPFAVIGLFCVALFGKAVILAWLGGRVLRVRGNGEAGMAGAVATPHVALAVLIGGAIALALYIVPFFGFVFYKLLGFLGFGAVVYTAILGLRARQAAKNGGGYAAVGGAAPAGSAPASDSGAGASPASNTAPYLSPAAMAQLPRAGFWIRMAALLLDVLLVGLVTHLLHTFPNAHLVLLAIYGAIMWKLRGATVGGIVFDLRVVRLDGREMDWESSIIRALSCFLSLAVAGLGFFWIAFDPANQAWHDKIAGTVVVRVPKATGAA